MKSFVLIALVMAIIVSGCVSTDLESNEPQTSTVQTPDETVAPGQDTTTPEVETPSNVPVVTGQENDGGLGGDAPNTFQDGRVEITPGEYIYNEINSEDDVDFYTFTIGAGEYFEVKVVPNPELDAELLIHDEGGEDITWTFTNAWGKSTDNGATFRIDGGIAGEEESFWTQRGSEETAYTYYFSVHSKNGTGNYTLILETKGQNDGASGKDAGEIPSKAIAIPKGSSEGLLNLLDRKDCYKLSTGGTVEVTVTPETELDVSFTIHDHGGKDITWNLTNRGDSSKNDSMFDVDDADAGIPEEITWNTTGSTQYICLYNERGNGSYTVTYS